MLGLFGQSSLRRWQLYLFDDDGRMYYAIIIVNGQWGHAYVIGQDEPAPLFLVTPEVLDEAGKMGYKVIFI